MTQEVKVLECSQCKKLKCYCGCLKPTPSCSICHDCIPNEISKLKTTIKCSYCNAMVSSTEPHFCSWKDVHGWPYADHRYPLGASIGKGKQRCLCGLLKQGKRCRWCDRRADDD